MNRDESLGHPDSENRPQPSAGRRWRFKITLVLCLVGCGWLLYEVIDRYRMLRAVGRHRNVYDAGNQLLEIAEQVLDSQQPADQATNRRVAQQAEFALRDFLQRDCSQPVNRLCHEALLLRSAAVVVQGRLLEARSLFQKVAVSQCESLSLLPAALNFFEAGEWNIAEQLITAAVQRPSGDRARTLRIAAFIHYDLGHQDQVITLCQEWVELRPDAAEPWQLLGFVFEDRGEWETSLNAKQRQLALTPQPTPDEHQQVIDLLIRVGDAARAREQFQQLERLAPKDTVRLIVTAAKLSYLEGDLNQALQKLQTVLTAELSATERTTTLFWIGRVQLAQQQFTAAEVALRKVVTSEPRHAEAHYLLGQALARQNQLPDAQGHLRLHRRLLETKIRINALERLAGRDPRNVTVRQELSRMYRDLGLNAAANSWAAAAKAAAQDQ